MSSGRGTHFTTAFWESGDCSEVQNDTFAEPAQRPSTSNKREVPGGRGAGRQRLHHSGLSKKLESENIAN